MRPFLLVSKRENIMKYMTGNWVVAGSLICAPEPVSMQVLDDIKAALLFAELTADDRQPGKRSSSQWFAEHIRALVALKWTGTESKSFDFEVDDESVVTIASTIERFLLNGMGPEYAAQGRQALACLTGEPELPARALFRSFACAFPSDEDQRRVSATETTVALLITVLRPNAVVECLWMAVSTLAQPTEDFLHQPLIGKQIRGPLQVRVFQRQWNAVGYDTVRARVESYLAGKRADLIMPLECADELAQS